MTRQVWSTDPLQIVLGRIPERFTYELVETQPDPRVDAAYRLSIRERSGGSDHEALDVEGARGTIVRQLLQWLDGLGRS